MNTQRIVLCPGQGAQALGMGKAWSEVSPEARAVFDSADEILGDSLGSPLSRICFEGPAETLNRTDVCQPALFVTGVACWRALCAGGNAGWAGTEDVVASAGLSLGEYTALHVTGAIGFEAGLCLVALRGRAMQDAAESTPSGMVALIGADEARAREICSAAAEGETLVVANLNAPGQVVISGSAGACERSVEAASAAGLRAQPLPVAGAFHSPIMASAAKRLAEALESTEIAPPRGPVISNVTGRPHDMGDHGSLSAAIRTRLVEQLTAPVRWADGCAYLAEKFATPKRGEPLGEGSRIGESEPGSIPSVEFHELAPGKTLSGLFRRIDRSIKVTTHDQPTASLA